MEKKKRLTLTYFILKDIAMAMNNNSYEMNWYLDLEREETTFISEYDEVNDQLAELIENDDDEERFIPIPMQGSRDGWRQMERFILSLDDLDETVVNLLHTTIRGRGAFSRFKDAIYTAGVEERWYEFRDREDTAEVLEWLHSLDLINDEDIEKGMQLYEERLSKQKKRKENIANMKKGTKVICSDNHGHSGRISPGKMYDVLDEQEQHLNIRLKDDTGKVRWYPKSHFELMS